MNLKQGKKDLISMEKLIKKTQENNEVKSYERDQKYKKLE